MSSDSSQSTPTPTTAEQKAAQFESIKKNTALVCLVLCPTLALLPPRKLDFYTFSLTGVWLASANHLTYTYTGRSAWQRIALPKEQSPLEKGPAELSGSQRYEEVQKRLREQGIKGSEKKSTLGSLWMGGEKEGWKERRMKGEREALEKGEGYGSLIAKHFREAFGVREKNEDEKSKEDDRDEDKG